MFWKSMRAFNKISVDVENLENLQMSGNWKVGPKVR